MVMFAPGGIAGLLAMQAPVLAARRLHRVLPYYLLALVPGVVAVIGFSVLIETAHQFSIRAAYGAELTLYGLTFSVASPLPWALGLLLAAGGTWLFLRAARLARNAYGEAVAAGRAA
jgi:branched-chain amino acid transport system permease protein